MNRVTILLTLASVLVIGADRLLADVKFSQSAESVEVYDFVEVTIAVDSPSVSNPFTDAMVAGEFQIQGKKPIPVDGFCDSPDGSLHRIRFMPSKPGEYSYVVTYRAGDTTQKHAGTFHATPSRRRGPVRVDKDHPFHFIWEGTGEHYFWNGTTTYWLMGWDDQTIHESIDRLSALKVNWLRVLLSGRVKSGRNWAENVYATNKFKFVLNPWAAQRPEDVDHPGFDVTRFNLTHWQKYERLLRYAREKDMLVSVIFYVDANKPGVDPFGKAGAGGPDEQRYYRYAAARLAGFSNVSWNLSNEYRRIRTDDWANRMGDLLKEWDPYDHLASIHGYADFHFRKSPWADLAMYQSWDEKGGYEFMLKNRVEQVKSGRSVPQVNEEYGYEDHYPRWEGNRKSPARNADNRRRLAWEMYMAGGYQTTGERADRGTGWGADTGGGWINGRGDDTMVMLKGYGHIVEFFTGSEWWKMEPHNELVSPGALCLAELGKAYAIYLPSGGNVTVKLMADRYRTRWFNPRTGAMGSATSVEGPSWTSPQAENQEDWALILEKSP